jgi:hypothetical protein
MKGRKKMGKSLWKNEHFKSIIIAVVFVSFIVGLLFFIDKIPGQLPSRTLIGGTFFGLMMILFPKRFHEYAAFISGKTGSRFDKKIAVRYRLTGVGILIFTYIVDKWIFR